MLRPFFCYASEVMKLGILKSRWLALIHDLSWIPAMIVMAFLLRFNFEAIPESHIAALWQLMLAAAVHDRSAKK